MLSKIVRIFKHIRNFRDVFDRVFVISVVTTPGTEHGTRPKRPGSGVGPGGGCGRRPGEARIRGAFWGSPIGENVRPSVRPSGKKINCHVFGIYTLLFESGGKHLFGIEALRNLGEILAIREPANEAYP